MSDLSLMILCGRSPRHLYVANRLCGAARAVAIVQEQGAPTSRKKLAELWKPEKLWGKAWRWARDKKRFGDGKEALFFFGPQPPSLDRADLLTRVPSVNDPRVLALAEKLRPDVIAVFGTSLLKGDILKQGRLGIINLHGGVTPEYRGADGIFWALFNGEPEQAGCTLHFIDAGIDTGKVIAQIRPEIREGDDELSLFWRATRESADVYAEILERLGRGDRLGKAHEKKGKLYLVKARDFRHELRMAWKMRRGLLRGVRLPVRVRWFPGDEVAPPVG